MQRYTATAMMCLREKGYFGMAELLGAYLMRAVQLVAMLFIWNALFAQGADLDGFTLAQMLSYTLLSSVLHPMLNVRTPASSWMHDGQLLSLYQRPASLFGQLAAHTVGGWLMQLMLYALPVLAIGALCGIDLVPHSGWFFVSLPLAVLQGFAVDFLFTCLLIRLRGLEWSMHYIREALSAMLTGALIPFAALPWGLGEWLALSPLGTLAGAPLSLFVGLAAPARILIAQVFWNAVLWPLAIWLFGRSRERMVAYGG